jgi:MYXO-CTERM domain-containing protein
MSLVDMINRTVGPILVIGLASASCPAAAEVVPNVDCWKEVPAAVVKATKPAKPAKPAKPRAPPVAAKSVPSPAKTMKPKPAARTAKAAPAVPAKSWVQVACGPDPKTTITGTDLTRPVASSAEPTLRDLFVDPEARPSSSMVVETSDAVANAPLPSLVYFGLPNFTSPGLPPVTALLPPLPTSPVGPSVPRPPVPDEKPTPEEPSQPPVAEVSAPNTAALLVGGLLALWGVRRSR